MEQADEIVMSRGIDAECGPNIRIAVYGGTFNPIHNGHINLALAAIKALNLDRLIIIPNNIPPHKSAAVGASNLDRFNMCCLASKGHDKIVVSDIELNIAGVSYTIDTLTELRRIYPLGELYLLVGSDMLFSFSSWHRPEDILKLARLCVAPRFNNEYDKLAEYVMNFHDKGYRVEVLDVSPFEISSTAVRGRIARGENISGLVPREVERYINENNLYK